MATQPESAQPLTSQIDGLIDEHDLNSVSLVRIRLADSGDSFWSVTVSCARSDGLAASDQLASQGDPAVGLRLAIENLNAKRHAVIVPQLEAA